MGRFTDLKVQEFLNTFDRVWISMHHENPETSDPFSSEIVGGSYERSQVRFGSASGRTISSITPAKFSGLPSVMVTHLGGWDAQMNGNMDFYVALAKPVRMKLGQTMVWNAGSITLSIR